MSASGSEPASRAKRRRAGKILAAVGVVAVLVPAGWIVGRGGPARAGNPVTVSRDDLVLTVEATGELAAVRATDIGAPAVRNMWDYKIAMMVPESTEVKEGDPVVAFDTQNLEKQMEEKEAELAEAEKWLERREIELSLALRDLEMSLVEARAKSRKASLKIDVPQDLAQGLEYREAQLDREAAVKETVNLEAKLTATREAGEADLKALTRRRDRARARVTELEESIESMTVLAPQDGIVIYKSNWRGEKKKVGDSTWIGEKLVELPDLSEMKANAEVDEADAGRVSVGQKSRIRLEAHPDMDFEGRVKEISRTVKKRGWRDPVKVYKVEVELDETDSKKMRPAMRFRGTIETGRIPDLLLAPRNAIFLRPSGPVAWVERRGGYEQTPVTLGRSNRELVEITGGLSEGDRLSLTDLQPPRSDRIRAPRTPRNSTTSGS